MRVVVQRVKSARVLVDGAEISSIGKGLLCLCGLHISDEIADLDFCSTKLLNLPLWPDDLDSTPWKKSVLSADLEVLCVSQFTLYANFSKGPKPDFHLALPSDKAKDLYSSFLDLVRTKHSHPGKVKDGVFGAKMEVQLSNDGPVTIQLDSEERLKIKPDEPFQKPTIAPIKDNVNIDVQLKRVQKKLAKLSALKHRLESGQVANPNPSQLASLKTEHELLAQIEHLKKRKEALSQT